MSHIVDEKLEFLLLKTLIKNKIERFSVHDLPKPIENLIGKGEWEVVHGLATRGILLNENMENNFFSITKVGKNRYSQIKRENIYKNISSIGAFLTFLSAMIGCWFSYHTYHRDKEHDLRLQKETAVPLQTEKKPQTNKTTSLTRESDSSLLRPHSKNDK